jgi:protocatechuate 3,4-dioxygenase beta subunit
VRFHKTGFLLFFGIWLVGGPPLTVVADYQCLPTRPDMKGPFYQPGAPLRSSVGKGYAMIGTVKSARDCTSIAGAVIEFWLTNPQGDYDDQHRATVMADGSGAYRFESARPTDYSFRQPHIHLRISALGFKPLVTQHYPEDGLSKARFDIVLVPED